MTGDLFDQAIPERPESLTFNQGMRLFRLLHWDRKDTAPQNESVCRYLVEFFDGRMLHLIGRQDANNCLTWLRTTKVLGAWSLIKARMILTLLFNKFDEWKEDGVAAGYNFSGLALPRKNPGKMATKVAAPKPTVFISPWEFRKWLKMAVKANDDGFAAAFKLGLWCRLAPIDIEHLNDSEVDDEAFEIRVYRRHTKTDKNPTGCLQVISMTEKLWAEINRCRRFRKPGETRIIPIQVNKRRRFAKIRKLARAHGMRDITLGVLRRSASDFLLEENFSADAVADAMGHTTTKVLDHHYSSKKRTPFRREISQKLTESFQ